MYPFSDGQNAHCALNIYVTAVARVKTIPLHPVQKGIGRGRPWGGVEGLEKPYVRYFQPVKKTHAVIGYTLTLII